MEFAIDRAEVHIHGVLGDGEVIGNFLFDHALDEESEDIFFA